MLSGKKVLLGITGSIAAYKSAFLVRLLIKSGAEVRVLMTKAAQDFISPLTLQTLSKQPVLTDIASEESWNNHVELGLWADVFLIAPLTANTLAKMAHGICDNILTASYLSARSIVMIAPAMDLDMWNHPTTKRNLNLLIEDGVQLVPVGDGELASGLHGPGRMAEPEQMVELLSAHFKKKSNLKELSVLVTAGPTYEDLDPVRFIGNRSSGKMGLAIAKTLAARGAMVDLVIGPNHLETNTLQPNITVHHVRSADSMAKTCEKIWPKANVAILAAAVADFTPQQVSSQKIKKEASSDELNLTLIRTKDIAKSLGLSKHENQICVGFALETQDGSKNARRKLQKKNFDFIVLNSLQDQGAGFQHSTNKVTFIFEKKPEIRLPLKLKTEVARDIVDQVEILAIEKKIIT